MIILFSCGFNFYAAKKENDHNLKVMSRAFFNEVVVTREWNAMHGGVYVPQSESNPPNPYLEDSLRDVETTGGMKLTKVNPAYMTRQVAEINNERYDVAFHITSLNPIRPQNRADGWETNVLEGFEINPNERFEFVKTDRSELYRYMAPLFVKPSCMSCHAKQGYKVGEVRGGISVSIPASPYLKELHGKYLRYLIFHMIFLVAGIMLIRLFYRKMTFYSRITEAKNKELLNANATKDKLFSIIAHDLRSPFSTITSITDLIGDMNREFDMDKVQDLVGGVNSLSKNASVLLENLLNWSKTQTGEINFQPESFLVDEIILKVLNIAKVQAKSKQVSIHYEPREDIVIYADKNMLSVIIHNLLSNAIKFSYAESKVYIHTGIIDKYVQITVIDEGIGIEEEKLGDVFSISKQSIKRGTANEQGSGLGLILVKEFVDYHKGKIEVESEQGKGTRFKLYFPFKKE